MTSSSSEVIGEVGRGVSINRTLKTDRGPATVRPEEANVVEIRTREDVVQQLESKTTVEVTSCSLFFTSLQPGGCFFFSQFHT